MAGDCTNYSDKKVIILLEDVDRLTLTALNYAKDISDEIVAFSGITRQDKEEEMRAEWNKTGIDVPYIIKFSPIKSPGELLVEYIESPEYKKEDNEVIVVVPLLIMKSLFQKYLNRSYLKRLKRSISDKRNIVLFKAPLYLDKTA
jgi:hypothetical protein